MDLAYNRSPLEDADIGNYRVEEVDAGSLANLPGGIDGTRPSGAALSKGRQQFMDLAGDGNLDLVDLSGPAPGFYERTLDAGWAGFRPFHSLPVQDWSGPNLRFVDLRGDGIADVLITEDDAFTWHPSLLQEGFGPAVRVVVPLGEGKEPHVVFADGTQSIYLADMSGDGLADIVRIRNGEVCYWPNRGYGRFGAKITMDRSPWFDEPDRFDQQRVRLADTDGSGTTDILYLARHGVTIFLNETGNGWSGGRELGLFPAIDDVASIMVTDFLGRGTACVVWSSPLPSDSGRQLRYVDLMRGQKPHLLVHSDNNLGAETRITYASSTEFYLADRAAGTPWVTRLPFPVHVVARVETYDHVSRNRFVTRYTYHHGFYDELEREFRGFGRVDQLDTEEFAALTASGAFPLGDNIAASSNVPPVLTKTWFHTGVYLQGGRISRHLAHEYCQEGSRRHGEAGLSYEQSRAMLLDDTILPAHLTPEEAREACRSLKGSTLRQEVYALDGQEKSSRPYIVSESNLTIRLLQHRWTNRHAVFFTHARESITFHYERELYDIDGRRRADPRVSHPGASWLNAMAARPLPWQPCIDRPSGGKGGGGPAAQRLIHGSCCNVTFFMLHHN
jgi:Insecticide toxin TcdB middle/N-terminal region/Insecticide toxin TcdB middle/C-terminal region